MEKSPTNLGLILCMTLNMSQNLIASHIYSEEYENASSDPIYGNACMVRSYKDHQLLFQGNGTLCEHKGVKFILTTSAIISGNRNTVLLDGEDEKDIAFSEILDLTDHRRHRRSEIAISFMDSYPLQIMPARIDTAVNFTEPFQEIHVVGFAHRLLPESTYDSVVFSSNESCSNHPLKRILVPFNPSPVHQIITDNNVAQPDLKSTTGYSNHTFNGVELPLPPGITGAAIRTREGNVAGVALGAIPHWRTDHYLELHPIKYRLLHMTYDWLKSIENSYKLSISSLTIGSAISYAAFTYYIPLGILSCCATGLTTWFTHRLPVFIDTFHHYTFPAGSENYGMQLSPWIVDLERKLNAHVHTQRRIGR